MIRTDGRPTIAMRESDRIVSRVLDPRLTNLGSVGVAMQDAARKFRTGSYGCFGTKS